MFISVAFGGLGVKGYEESPGLNRMNYTCSQQNIGATPRSRSGSCTALTGWVRGPLRTPTAFAFVQGLMIRTIFCNLFLTEICPDIFPTMFLSIMLYQRRLLRRLSACVLLMERCVCSLQSLHGPRPHLDPQRVGDRN